MPLRNITLLLIIISWLMPVRVLVKNYMFKHIEAKDGLASNRVKAIFKDSQGYMWFGTVLGLNRYDGTTIRTFQSLKDGTSRSLDNDILLIQEDANGYLWIETTRGYNLYNPVTLSINEDNAAYLEPMGLNELHLERVFIDKAKNLWVWSRGLGMYMVRPGGTAQKVNGLPQDVLGVGVSSIVEAREGIIAVCDDGTLLCFDASTSSLKWRNNDIVNSKNDIKVTLYVDAEDDLWIYSASAIYAYSLSRGKWMPHLAEMARGGENDMVQSVAQDEKGLLWFGRDKGGIAIMDKKREKIVDTIMASDYNPRQLQNNSVLSLYFDNGVMWVGTYKKGVFYYSESQYKFKETALGDINCIEDNGDGTVWAGTNDGDLLLWNHDTGEVKTLLRHNEDARNSNAIVTLKRTRDGKLWIGTFRGGLKCYDGHKISTITAQEGGLASNDVWAIEEDADGNLWLGTLGRGLQCYNPSTGKFSNYYSQSSLPHYYISSVKIYDRQLLMGHGAGISIMDLDTRAITNLNGNVKGTQQFTNNVVNQAIKDSNNLIWIATGQGINVYDQENDTIFYLSSAVDNYLPMVASITEDDNRNVWVTTSRGLTKVIPIIDRKNKKFEFQTTSYTTADGLMNCDVNLRSMCRLSDGCIVFGGMYGVNYFHPNEIKYNEVLPNVFFTDVYLLNQPVEVGKEYDGNVVMPTSLASDARITLKNSQNSFTVHFATDNYILPEKTTYEYMLEGLNKEWLKTHRAEISYNNMAYGSYTLRVRAINSDGYVGNNEAVLAIEIKPPFYLSHWAIMLYVLLLGGIIWLWRYVIVRQERSKFQVAQLQQEAIKEREINDAKLRFFTLLSHELRTPLSLIISPLELMLKEPECVENERLNSRLRMMLRNATRLLNLVNQLLDFRRGAEHGHTLVASEGDIIAFTRNVCQSFNVLTERKKVHLTFFSAIKTLKMMFDSDKCGKIVSNLLSNAFKFTPDGGRVDVSMSVVENGEKSILEIRVADTGIGIPDEYKTRIFESFYQIEDPSRRDEVGSGVGLSLVKEFVELHGGDVRVMDNVPKGSVFIVHLPIVEAQPSEVPEVGCRV